MAAIIKACPTCGGEGVSKDRNDVTHICSTCDGKGSIRIEEPEKGHWTEY